VPNQSAPPAPLDSVAYAESLHGYAAQRLDAFSLRCWIIQRLMLDEGLDHSCAEDVCEHVLAAALNQDCAREVRTLSRRKRFREARTSPHGWTRRRLHSQRPAGHTSA
jgi:hypothetical protein